MYQQLGLRGDLTMTTALRGRPGRGIGPLKEKTVHAVLTKQRIHAIVAQVIDELEHRRATGKADYVKALADEVQRGGIAAWKALRDLLPRDEDMPSARPSVSLSQFFVAAHKEINRSEQAKTVPPVIDATAEPVKTGASEEEVDWWNGVPHGVPLTTKT
jgi:hypothetical protein